MDKWTFRSKEVISSITLNCKFEFEFHSKHCLDALKSLNSNNRINSQTSSVNFMAFKVGETNRFWISPPNWYTLTPILREKTDRLCNWLEGFIWSGITECIPNWGVNYHLELDKEHSLHNPLHFCLKRMLFFSFCKNYCIPEYSSPLVISLLVHVWFSHYIVCFILFFGRLKVSAHNLYKTVLTSCFTKFIQIYRYLRKLKYGLFKTMHKFKNWKTS